MKIWLKFLIGSALGLVLGIFVSPSDGFVGSISSVVLNIGRYALAPLVLFSFAVSLYELKSDKLLASFAAKAALVVIGSTVILVLVALVSVTIAPPAEIFKIRGVSDAAAGGAGSVDIAAAIKEAFPANLFAVFASPENYMMPICVLAAFLGFLFTQDKSVAKPLLPIFDAASRIFYHLNSIIVEFLEIGMIALGANSMLSIKRIGESPAFAEYVGHLLIDAGVVVLVVYPGIIYLITRKNPYKWIYACLAPMLAAAFSGDHRFALSSAIKATKENLMVRRRVGSLGVPLMSLFARGGTALVSTVSFIFLFNTYSKMGISADEVLLTLGSASLASALLWAVPGGNARFAMAFLLSNFSALDGKGIVYLEPVIFVALAVAALLDTLTASLGTFLVARWMGLAGDREARFFA
jgi:Na+/H+-dicarboxylate symporter